MHLYNSVHIYCRLYIRPQTPTDYKRNYNTREILLYFIVKRTMFGILIIFKKIVISTNTI